jgi:hypothetical protein
MSRQKKAHIRGTIRGSPLDIRAPTWKTTLLIKLTGRFDRALVNANDMNKT